MARTLEAGPGRPHVIRGYVKQRWTLMVLSHTTVPSKSQEGAEAGNWVWKVASSSRPADFVPRVGVGVSVHFLTSCLCQCVQWITNTPSFSWLYGGPAGEIAWLTALTGWGSEGGWKPEVFLVWALNLELPRASRCFPHQTGVDTREPVSLRDTSSLFFPYHKDFWHSKRLVDGKAGSLKRHSNLENTFERERWFFIAMHAHFLAMIDFQSFVGWLFALCLAGLRP